MWRRTHKGMQDAVHDVVVVGAGPVGLGLARLLGLAGHEVLVLERWSEPYPLPRAVHFDDEIGRVFADMGLAEQVRAVSEPVPDHYEWRNADGQALVRIDWSGTGPSGWPTANFFSQPQLEAVLAEAVTAMPNVTLQRGAEVVGVEEQPDSVLVTFAGTVAKQRRVRARYVVGADGANSFVRERMGAVMHDQGFFFDWLIVDTIPRDDAEFSPMNWQLCDPARPTTIVSGGPGRRRWEFMRLPSETHEQLGTTEKAWQLLAHWGRTPANTDLERHAIYTFAARWADRWNRGRLLIAGDAAHQMPPFAGQGMCSGIRDAANLSWKLDRVLRGTSQQTLLDTYTSERSTHVQHAIAMSVELGRVICVGDPDKAAERDTRMIAGGADPAVVLPVTAEPVLGDGVTAAAGDLAALRGTLAPQYPLARDGSHERSDEVTGRVPVLLMPGEQPSTALLDAATAGKLAAERITAFSIGQSGTPDLADDGEWTDWFNTHSIAAVLIRPDHYIFGAMSAIDGIGNLVADYRSRLHTTTPSDTHAAATAATSA